MSEAMTDFTTQLTEEQREQLARYRDLIVTWNRRFNLTAIKEPDEVDRRLIGDALLMLPAVDDAVAAWRSRTGRQSSAEPARLIDIGSGAGLPGMVVKIARPAIDVTLVEATGKKVGFVRHVAEELGLPGFEAVHGRAEELGQNPEYREQFDIVTARAVAALPVLMELCIPFLRIGGHALFPKGAEIADELAAGERAASIVGARIVSHDALPATLTDSVTRLVIAVKIGVTQVKYPRRAGVPAHDPLGRVAQ